MAKETKNEDVQTLDAVDEDIENQNVDNVDAVESDTENTGEDTNTEIAPAGDGTVVIDGADDSGIKPLAADDYVENFVINGSTYAVRDAEAQASITELNSAIQATRYDMSGVTYNTSVISSLTITAYSSGGLVVICGTMEPVSTAWISNTDGAIGNLPFTINTAGTSKSFPCSTYTNTSRGLIVTSNSSTPFFFNGTPEGGASYAFCVILPLAT